MNLKEAFRYQKFLETTMQSAAVCLNQKSHALKTTKLHLCSKANPAAQDYAEEEVCGEFYPNDDVLRLMSQLIAEKGNLCRAISEAKAASGINIDAEIETNKFRQQVISSIKSMLSFKPGKQKLQGRGYMLDVNQTQVPYFYDVEITTEDNFDRTSAKALLLRETEQSDRISTQIEAAMVNTPVTYTPPYNVNASFDDVMQQFLTNP